MRIVLQLTRCICLKTWNLDTMPEKWAAQGKVVICAGLAYTHERTPIQGMARLQAQADQLVSLTTKCGFCGQLNAGFTARTTPISGTLVGGARDYQPACRSCWLNFLLSHHPLVTSHPFQRPPPPTQPTTYHMVGCLLLGLLLGRARPQAPPAGRRSRGFRLASDARASRS